MKTKTIILTFVLFFLIVGGMYIYMRIKKTELLTDMKTAMYTSVSSDKYIVS